MAPEESRSVEVAGLGDKIQITATFAGTLSGEFLPTQLLYQGKTDRCHAKFTFSRSLPYLPHTKSLGK